MDLHDGHLTIYVDNLSDMYLYDGHLTIEVNN